MREKKSALFPFSILNIVFINFVLWVDRFCVSYTFIYCFEFSKNLSNAVYLGMAHTWFIRLSIWVSTARFENKNDFWLILKRLLCHRPYTFTLFCIVILVKTNSVCVLQSRFSSVHVCCDPYSVFDIFHFLWVCWCVRCSCGFDVYCVYCLFFPLHFIIGLIY